jgi:hypothetical protein
MRRSISLGVFAMSVAGFLSAESKGAFRIELVNGGQLSSLNAPVRRGSVVTFRSPDGKLTGIPAEWVTRVVGPSGASAAANRRLVGTAPARRLEGDIQGGVATGLEPGDVVVIGPTGGGAATSPAAGAATAGTVGGGNAGGMASGTGAYGGGAAYPANANGNVVDPNLVLNPNLTGVGSDGLPRVMSSTDLSRALGAGTTGTNGFPATTPGAPTVIGPNGTPTFAPGVPGSSTPVIGPNGTPVLAQPGQSGSATTQPATGPNGTPVLAPSGQPGAAPPAIGPNGTPVLAPQGQPGSAPPGTAPNGTPASPPPSGGTAGSSPGAR